MNYNLLNKISKEIEKLPYKSYDITVTMKDDVTVSLSKVEQQKQTKAGFVKE